MAKQHPKADILTKDPNRTGVSALIKLYDLCNKNKNGNEKWITHIRH